MTASTGAAGSRMVALVPPVAAETVSPPVVARALPAYAMTVSRPPTGWRWSNLLLAPVELLALAMGFPVVILLVMVPLGLVLAGALWLSRLLLGL